MQGFYTNNKTGHIYSVLFSDVTNTTNEEDGKLMVVYMDRHGRIFTREYREFAEKFTKYVQCF